MASQVSAEESQAPSISPRSSPPEWESVGLSEGGGDLPQVADEGSRLGLAGRLVGRAKDRGGVDGGRNERGELRRNEGAAALRDAEGGAEQRLRRGGAKADDDLRPDQCDLRVEPGAAGGDLCRIGLLVDSLLASRLPFEVLDDVGDVGLRPVDAGLLQAGIEESSRRTDERPPFDVFTVARLLADQDDQRVPRSLAEDGLRAPLPEGTGAATLRRLPQPGKRRPVGNERKSRALNLRAQRHGFPASIERAKQGSDPRLFARPCLLPGQRSRPSHLLIPLARGLPMDSALTASQTMPTRTAVPAHPATRRHIRSIRERARSPGGISAWKRRTSAVAEPNIQAVLTGRRPSGHAKAGR